MEELQLVLLEQERLKLSRIWEELSEYGSW
jgi:hypothetical protein